MLRTLFSVLGLLATSTIAAPSETTQRVCEEISTVLPDRVSMRLTIPYSSEVSSYWSTALRDLKPACVVFPRFPEEVAAAVRVLNKAPDVQFAVKSGGHDPNVRHASVQDGVLISTKDLTGVTYDADRNLAFVRPGGEWNDVIGPLDEQGVAIVGGRLGTVAQGLLWVNGYAYDAHRSRGCWRLSPSRRHFLSVSAAWLSCRCESTGSTCSDSTDKLLQSIIGWEIVTSNGTIINVDAAESPELAVALRGSGSQFG